MTTRVRLTMIIELPDTAVGMRLNNPLNYRLVTPTAVVTPVEVAQDDRCTKTLWCSRGDHPDDPVCQESPELRLT